MKTKLFIKVLFLSLSFVYIGCSGDSKDDDSGGNSEVTSILLLVDQTSIEVGGSFAFTVKDNNNNDITSQSTINVDGVAISGSVFTPGSEGTYTINASYQNFNSASLTLTVTNSQILLSSIVLNSDKNQVVRGEAVTLTVTGNEGSNFTSEATYSVNGVDITGNSYVTDTFGTDTIIATYDTFTSNEKEVFVGHTQKVLIEDYTGAWCGWCPRVAYGIELVESQTDNAVVVAIHRGTSSGSYYDPFNYPASELEDFINLSGYPTAMLNRIIPWTYPEPNNVSQVLNYTSSVSTLGLGVTSQLNGSNLDISVRTNYASGSVDGHKLVVYVLEDGLIQDQTNYTSYYGGTSVISDFRHNNVLRQVPTGLFGEDFVSQDYDANLDVYTKNYNFTLTSGISDINQLSIAVFVVNENGLVINSKYATVGQDVDFD
jgi:hypothetical protein